MKPVRAAVYCRISLDSTGEGAGVQRQEEICREWATGRGWTVAQVYVEDPISAYKPEKARPQYNRMLRDLEEGTRDGVIAYAPDRLTRQTKQLLALVELAQHKSFPIGTVQGELDLATPQGRTMALIAARFSQQESEVKGERQRVANSQRVRQGKPLGNKRAFGWSDRTRQEVHPVEGPAIEKACRDILAGKSTTEIAREWNEHGPAPLGKSKTDGGKALWRNNTVYTMLTRPYNAGIVVYKGEELPDVEAQWAPIISRELFEQMKAKLSRAEPVTRRRPSKYLLSGLLVCSKCGSTMSGTAATTGEAYQCNGARTGKRCHTSVQRHIAEGEVTAYVTAALNSLKPGDLLGEEEAAEQARVARELLEIDSERVEGEAAGLSMKSRLAFLRGLDKREETLREQLATLTKGNAITEAAGQILPWARHGVVSTSDAALSLTGVREAFGELSLSQRRLIVEAMGKYYVRPGQVTPRVLIYPKDIKTGEVSHYSTNEDPYAMEDTPQNPF